MAFNHQPNLVGDLLTLRPLREDDFDRLYAAASDPLIWQQHPVPNRYEEPVFRQFFEESLRSGGALVTVNNGNNEVIGSSRYHAYSENASEVEIGWTFLTRTYWGGDYNGELKQLMLLHAFCYVESVVMLVDPDNIRSQRALEKVGGKRDGVRANASGIENYLYRIRRS